MNPTSLHTILSRESSPLREDELMYLFSAPRFPRFELHDLLSNNHLLKNTRFSFFLQILEKWNSKVDAEKPEGIEIEYRKNEFIFSWLKGVAVQNSGNIDSSLQKLYEWYSSNSEHDVVCNVRKENVYRSRL